MEGDELLNLAKLTDTFGTADIKSQMFLLDQIVQTFKGSLSSEGVCENSKIVEFANHAVAVLQGIRPRDEVEGMLALQMIGVHNMAMDALKLAMISGQYPESIERNTNRATKLLRTFATQMEALKKYRRGGEQNVNVKHVHVNEGGQAIVGNVSAGAGGGRKG